MRSVHPLPALGRVLKAEFLSAYIAHRRVPLVLARRVVHQFD